MRSHAFHFFCLLALLMMLPVRAEEITGDNALLAPYLSSTTLLLGRLDVTRLDAEAIQSWELTALKAATTDKQTLRDGEAAIGQLFTGTRTWAAAFVKAGGKRVYAVVDVSLFPREPFVLIVPVEAGANVSSLQNVMRYGDDRAPAKAKADESGPEVMLVDNKVILWGEKESVTAIMHVKSAARPTLLKLLAASDTAAVTAAMDLTDELRQMASDFLPTSLPAELGGGKMSELLSAIINESATASLPPKAALNITMHCASEDAARRVQHLGTSALTDLVKDLAPSPEEGGLDWKGLSQFLMPELKGSDLSVSRNAAAIDSQLAGPLVLSIVKSYRVALIVRSMSNMRQLLTGSILYANDHQSAFPDELTVATIGEYLGGEEPAKRLLSNPRHPELNLAYVYLKPAKTVRNPGEVIVLYEATDKEHPDDHINVGYADGHCESMTRAEFEKLMKKASGGL